MIFRRFIRLSTEGKSPEILLDKYRLYTMVIDAVELDLWKGRVKIRPEGGERINMAISREIKEAFPREKC
ncbi:MAG: hypothetical protein ACE5HR_01695 [bacterium]